MEYSSLLHLKSQGREKYSKYLEYCYPCISNVIKVDGSFEWVVISRLALGIILIPVYTAGIVCGVTL